MFFSRMTVAARLYAGFGLILALLIVVTGVAVVKVSRIDQALRDNNNIHVQVQRYAINFRGSAHDRSIAVRDVVLSPTPAERDKEIATIAALADFYAQSATPLEKLVNRVGAPPELAPLYAGIRSAEAQAVASTQAIIEQVQSRRPARRPSCCGRRPSRSTCSGWQPSTSSSTSKKRAFKRPTIALCKKRIAF